MRTARGLAVAALALLPVACAVATPSPTPTHTSPPPTPTPAATPTPWWTVPTPRPTATPTPAPTATPTPTSTPTPPPPTATPLPTLIDAIRRVRPAVVRVIGEQDKGTGVIYDASGLVVTNNHVVKATKVAKVVLQDARTVEADVLGYDEVRDLAVLRLPAGTYPMAKLKQSTDLEVGTEVAALGYALDLPGEVTASRGIVSARRPGETPDVTYLQTDASINPGNSGGPLITLDGQVVGINTSIIRLQGGIPIQGVNFSLGVSSALPMLPILESGLVVPDQTLAHLGSRGVLTDRWRHPDGWLTVRKPVSWTLETDTAGSPACHRATEEGEVKPGVPATLLVLACPDVAFGAASARGWAGAVPTVLQGSLKDFQASDLVPVKMDGQIGYVAAFQAVDDRGARVRGFYLAVARGAIGYAAVAWTVEPLWGEWGPPLSQLALTLEPMRG
ncbi:MAG: trypsin-like peptidase domain-containing protein [Chloroflexi bacterium]|nr:trypsin-like peptidase domain-containing protein [Chloroflexota bacterium]